ncbi:hypothetical protein KBD49_00490 [Myxococcota bacterium]|nr:hypothetical protein [Myxococcota bacterium]
MTRRSGLAVVIPMILWASTALGQRIPAVGSRLPNVPFEDLEGREVRIRSFLGRPVLILYEDRSTAAWNRALKDQLVAMARRKELPPRLLVLPIVDLRAFRAWPARPIAQAQLRARSRELGKPLWADWSGLVAGALGVSGPGPAVVLLLDGRQRVIWAGSGRLDPRQVQELIALLRSPEGRAKAGPSGTPPVPEQPSSKEGDSGGESGGSSAGERPPGPGPEGPSADGSAESRQAAGEVPGGDREDASAEDPEEDEPEGIPLPPFVTPLGMPLPGGPPVRVPPQAR